MTRKFLVEQIKKVVSLNEPPQKIALAFAVGVFIAFSPTIGLHTLSVVFCAWVFRMNGAVVLAGALVNNPWTIAPIYAFSLYFGMLITGTETQPEAAPPWEIDWGTISASKLWHSFHPYLEAFIAGTVILGIAAALISYVAMLYAVRIYHERQPAAPHQPG